MIICPFCNTPTAFTPIYMTHHAVFGFTKGTEMSARDGSIVRAEMSDYRNSAKYAILECQSCSYFFIARKTYGTDWTSVYPIHHKIAPKELPALINEEYNEASRCFAIEAYKACASMCQRVMESLCQEQKVSSLNELRANGTISTSLFDRATEIRLWAGIIKHKPLTEAASKEDADQLLTYLELILHAVYVEPKRLETLRRKRQQLTKGKPK